MVHLPARLLSSSSRSSTVAVYQTGLKISSGPLRRVLKKASSATVHLPTALRGLWALPL
jgi:hypothetical protein